MSGPPPDGEAIFDYIIVGAGSAGCVLAERLSADPERRVLLLEEGPPDDNWLVRMPKGFGRLLVDPQRAHYYPTAHEQAGVPEVWVRGKMLGGSSAVNGMVWLRGQPEDYDRLADLGDPGWGWAEVLPYFRALEDYAPGADEWRGRGGPIAVKPHPRLSRLGQAFIDAGRQTGLPVMQDLNQRRQEAIGPLQWNIDRKGRRVSAAQGFLRKAQRRANLAVVTGVRTDRVLVSEGRAVGVAGLGGGEAVSWRARCEVILAAGAIGSPRILQLSGIGPAAKLASVGVTVLHDSPRIGKNMREHRLVMLNFRLRDGVDSQNSAYSGAQLAGNVLRYSLFGSGPMAFGSSEAAAFVRTQSTSRVPDAQLMFAPYSLSRGKGMAFEDQPGMQLYTFPLRPESQGSISIVSADPSAALEIAPNYLTAAVDRATSIAGVRTIRRIMSQPAISKFVHRETDDTASAQSDEDILALFSTMGQAGYHAVGTVAMGADAGAPLDGRLRVRGVERLRVMDCSIFPEMITGNTNAPTLACAMRAADLILQDRTG